MMRKHLVPGLIVLSAVLGVAVVVQAAWLIRLERKIDRIERGRVEIKTIVEREADRPDSAPAPAASPKPADPDLSKTIREVARNEIHEFFRREEEAERRRHNPDLATLARDLQLDPATEARAAEVFDRFQNEALALMGTMRADSGSFLQDFVSALKSDDGEQFERAMLRLHAAMDKLPGSGQAFIDRLHWLESTARQSFEALLDDEQRQRMEERDLDPLMIRTARSPWRSWFRAQGAEWPEDW